MWPACYQHKDYLCDYFEARGLPVVVAPIGIEVITAEPTDPGAAP